MIISAGSNLVLDLDIDVADAQGNPLVAEIRAAFVQGKTNVVKNFSNGEITIVEGLKNRILVHLTQEDTAQFKSGPNAMVDFQLFVLQGALDENGELVPYSDPLACRVVQIPIHRSLAEAIILMNRS